jgi:hypothetical protein
MENIQTNKGEVILVGKKYLNELKKYTWMLDANGYAVTTICIMSRKESRETGISRSKSLKMHRLIYELSHNVNLKSKEHIDHIDRNKINNTVSNLRISGIGTSINQINVGLRKDNTTGFKGVIFRKRTNKYEAKISYRSKRIWLGAYEDIIDAAKAYNKKAKELFGNCCYLNKVD